MNKLYITGVIILVFVVSFGIGRMSVSNDSIPLGGFVHNLQETFDAGIAIQGSEFIDADGDRITLGLTDGGCLKLRDVDDRGWGYATYDYSANAITYASSSVPSICQ